MSFICVYIWKHHLDKGIGLTLVFDQIQFVKFRYAHQKRYISRLHFVLNVKSSLILKRQQTNGREVHSMQQNKHFDFDGDFIRRKR